MVKKITFYQIVLESLVRGISEMKFTSQPIKNNNNSMKTILTIPKKKSFKYYANNSFFFWITMQSCKPFWLFLSCFFFL
jgi:hypothetical protein